MTVALPSRSSSAVSSSWLGGALQVGALLFHRGPALLEPGLPLLELF